MTEPPVADEQTARMMRRRYGMRLVMAIESFDNAESLEDLQEADVAVLDAAASREEWDPS